MLISNTSILFYFLSDYMIDWLYDYIGVDIADLEAGVIYDDDCMVDCVIDYMIDYITFTPRGYATLMLHSHPGHSHSLRNPSRR